MCLGGAKKLYALNGGTNGKDPIQVILLNENKTEAPKVKPIILN